MREFLIVGIGAIRMRSYYKPEHRPRALKATSHANMTTGVNMKFMNALIVLISLSSSAIAEECKSIADSAARLACFDALSSKPKAKTPLAKASGPKQIDDIAMAKRAVVRDLKDPASAQFGEVYRGPGAPGYAVVCGGVNAKNSYGGYTGMTAFVYKPEKDLAIILNAGGPDPSSVLEGLDLYKFNCADDKRAIMR
jgi:hypothetical protein